MKKFIALVVMLCTVMISSTAMAERGIVAFYSKSSRKIIIATNNGYTCGDVSFISMTYGLKRGNYVVGDLHSFGFQDLYDLTTDSSLTVWIKKCWASENDAMDWLQE